MIILFFFLLGIIIGSFLNVVICRLQTEETLMGRSHCTSCNQQIAWYDNVPVVSFLLLRAKCRRCKAKISWQYPMVELVTGIMFAMIGWLELSLFDVDTWLTTVFYLGLFSMLIVVFVYDLLTMYIPMIMIWIALAWTVVYLLLSEGIIATSYMSPVPQGILSYILSGVIIFGLFWFLVWVSHETWMGMGDAYLALLIGLAVGFPGVLWAMTFSFGTGAIIGLVLIGFGKKGMKSQVPFAPFLVIGLAMTIFLPKIFPILQSWMTL